MTIDQSYEIIEMIAAAYPMFDLTGSKGEKRIRIWIEHLQTMPFERVMKKLNEHIANHKFPPVIADISVELPQETTIFDQQKQWETQVKEERERGILKPLDHYLPDYVVEKYKHLFEGKNNGNN